ncbi:hypothetical protein [Mangrovicoccus ximenensis]|uniref:hypothetical protein n=1 Tax=Mangrovicoccus ximenensis TaxID=1911570 RepID=UPI000D398E0B|nr:hypothetical protein [Mangrovicoccus ximenensis]
MAYKGSIFGIDSIDSIGGRICRSNDDGKGAPVPVFDIATDLPDGLAVADCEGIANRAGGAGNKVYVAFTSDTLPNVAGTAAEDIFSLHRLPEFMQPGEVPVEAFRPDLGTRTVDDLYRLSEDDLSGFPDFIPKAVGIKCQAICEFDFQGNKLSNGTPVTAFEVQSSFTGHRGAGMAVLPDGWILWATGDNLPFGQNGRFGAQRDGELPSKLFLIDPETGDAEVAAKGLRNVQHLEIAGIEGTDCLLLADTGGVTAEEVNVVALDRILDMSEIGNFGWGVAEDGLAREGTFHVGGDDNGIAGISGTQPPATGAAPIGEAGFIQPHAQYGRIDAFQFVAASGPVVSETSFGGALTLVSGDLASGVLFGTAEGPDAVDADVVQLNLVDPDGAATSLAELAGGRPDPRFFTCNDGSAGVLVEATGEYFRLTEQALYARPPDAIPGLAAPETWRPAMRRGFRQLRCPRRRCGNASGGGRPADCRGHRTPRL